MSPLRHSDALHLLAAEGWLELGNHIEAHEELDQVTPQLRAHPDILEVRWNICAYAKNWDACVDIADEIQGGAFGAYRDGCEILGRDSGAASLGSKLIFWRYGGGVRDQGDWCPSFSLSRTHTGRISCPFD